MDRWTFLLTVIISILCGVAANLGTPAIAKLFTKGIAGYREARLKGQKSTLETILIFQRNPTLLILFLLKDILAAAMYFLTSVLMLGWAYSSDFGILKKIWFIPIGPAIGTLMSGFGFVRGVLTAGYTERLTEKFKYLESKVEAKGQIESTEKSGS